MIRSRKREQNDRNRTNGKTPLVLPSDLIVVERLQVHGKTVLGLINIATPNRRLIISCGAKHAQVVESQHFVAQKQRGLQ